MIDFQNVSVRYDTESAYALHNVSLHINAGEFVFIVGLSGAGKTTVIRSLLRELTVSEGKLIVDGTDLASITKHKLPYYRREVGVVFQDFRLIDTKTVYENVAFAMQAVMAKRAEIKERVPQVLSLVGLSSKAEKYPRRLSGGEKQRVAIARAIVNEPKILICDEPTGNLDPQTGVGIMNLLQKINASGTTVIVVTHNNVIVDSMKKRVIRLVHGEVGSDIESGEYIS